MYDQKALDHLHQSLDISRDDAEEAMWHLSRIMPTHDVDEHIGIELGKEMRQGQGYMPTIEIHARDKRVQSAAEVLMPKHVRLLDQKTTDEGLPISFAWVSRMPIPDAAMRAGEGFVPQAHHRAQEVIHAVMEAVRIKQKRAQEYLALD